MKILLTAFESFGKRTINASSEVLNALPDAIGNHLIAKEILPVDHQQAPEKLAEILQVVQPDAVICMGEAGGTDAVRLEFVAINWMDFRIPDNSGVAIVDAKIKDASPKAYFSTLPLRKFETALKEKEIPVYISMTAGTFLCNQIFFTLMDLLSSQQRSIPAGFIHLPAEIVGEADIEPNCSLEMCIDGMKQILETLVNS